MTSEKLPNLKHLKSLLLVIRKGSISAAANDLNVTQSAVSQGISGLETLTGMPLLKRSSRGVFPTASGRVFAHRIQRAFQHLRPIESMISAAAKKRTPLHQRVTAAQLRAIAAVTELGSHSEAARRLGLSQPSIQRAVKEFENACGEPVFQRSAIGVQPMATARRAARCANLASVELAYGLDELGEMQGLGRSRVRIGSLPLARADLVPTAVTDFLADHPAARVQIIDGPYDEMLQALVSGRIELLVGALRSPSPSRYVIQESLFEDLLSIVVRPGHPHVSTGSAVNAELLADLKWVVPRVGTPARDQFIRYFEDQNAPPPTDLIECSSLIATRSLVYQSDRAALLSRRQVSSELEDGKLVTLEQDLPGTARHIGVTYRTNWAPTPVQRAFLDQLRAASIQSLS